MKLIKIIDKYPVTNGKWVYYKSNDILSGVFSGALSVNSLHEYIRHILKNDLWFNLFDYKPKDITCHSGGAEGSDTIWESLCMLYGLKVKAWSYQTKYHKSINKTEVSEEDFQEGLFVSPRSGVLSVWLRQVDPRVYPATLDDSVPQV